MVARFLIPLCSITAVMLLSGCTVATASRVGRVEAHTRDRELGRRTAEKLSEKLRESGLAAAYEFDMRIDDEPGGGLRVNVLCSSRSDRLLRGSVQVRARGAQPEQLISPLVEKVSHDLASECQ